MLIITGMTEAGEDEVVSWLTRLYNNAVTEGDIPEEWGQSVVVPIFKKREITICGKLLTHQFAATCI